MLLKLLFRQLLEMAENIVSNNNIKVMMVHTVRPRCGKQLLKPGPGGVNECNENTQSQESTRFI